MIPAAPTNLKGKMMNEQNLKIVSDFQSAPSTPEKEEIAKQYLNDEISNFDFISMAKDYLENHQ